MSAALESWLAREQARFVANHPRSRAQFQAGERHYLYGAPMHWMRRWAGGFPLYRALAERFLGAFAQFCTKLRGSLRCRS